MLCRQFSSWYYPKGSIVYAIVVVVLVSFDRQQSFAKVERLIGCAANVGQKGDVKFDEQFEECNALLLI